MPRVYTVFFRWRQDLILALGVLIILVAGISTLFTAEPFMAWFILPMAGIPAFLWRKQILARACTHCHGERTPLAPDPARKYEVKYRCSACGDEVWSGICVF